MAETGVITLDGFLADSYDFVDPQAPAKKFVDAPGGVYVIPIDTGAFSETLGLVDNTGVTLVQGSMITDGGVNEWSLWPIAGYTTVDHADHCERCRTPQINRYRLNSIVDAGPFCTPCWDDILAIRESQAAG